MFEIGEVVHLWGGGGGRTVVPEEVTITAITERQITVRNANGELVRFRSRDRQQLGRPYGPKLEKLDRELAERQRLARELDDMRLSIFNGCDLGLQAMRHWSKDEGILRSLADAYREFLRLALCIGADVPPYLREWLAQDSTTAAE